MTDTNYKFEVGRYKTRGGFEAQVLDVNFNSVGGKVMLGKIKLNDYELACTWEKNGKKHFLNDSPSECDLMPPVETKEIWLNVYPEPALCHYKSKSLADEYSNINRIGQIKITITGDKYEVGKVEL
jgi:hypothetical protein